MFPWRSVSVCHTPDPCKTAERIEVLFGVETPEGPKDIVLNGVHPHEEGERRDFDAAVAK